MSNPQPHQDNRVSLPDGRALGYAEYGDPVGKPVLFFHGAPGSRLIHPPLEQTKELGVRLIAVERPGFGLSDYQPRRMLLDWPDDVAAFADALGLDLFAVVGLSAGGPYAVACAAKIPQRLTGAAIVGGVGPSDLPGAIAEMPRVRQIGATVARYAPWLVRPLLWLTSNPHRNPERFYARMCSGNAEVDRQILETPEVKDMLMSSYLEATRSGLRGFAREAIILSTSWTLALDEVTMPVHLWHGEADANVSLSAARYLARTLPNCQATFLPEQGHWLILDHWSEIVSAVV